MTAPALTFLAPPSFDDDGDGAAPVVPETSTTGPRRPRAHSRLRLTRGARAAASGMKIGDADIQRCLDAPDDASPDPNTPSRTRFRRGALMVVAGPDGMVLRVDRTGPDRPARPGATSRPARRRKRRPA